MPTCAGNPTFDLSSSSAAFSEWPSRIPGLVCKTPPMGSFSAPRFAQCCSGPVYNVTSPTGPDDDAYPVSCATFCQVAPELNVANHDSNPYGFSDHYMCLTDGGTLSDDGWEVVCDTLSVAGVAPPTSYASTPTGTWMTTATPSSSSEDSSTTTSEPGSSSSTSSGERPSSTLTETDASETSIPPRSSVAVTSKTSTDTTETASASIAASSATTTSSTSGAGRLTITTKNTFAGVLLLMVAWCSSSSAM